MNVGDTFILEEHLRLQSADGQYNLTFPSGALMRITRLYTDRAVVRGQTRDEWPAYGGERSAGISMLQLQGLVAAADPNAPRPRMLGETPEGGIDPRDPGLKWLWEDAAKVAKDEGYCGIYDQICAKLGIPGRPKNYTANIKIGQVTMTGKFLCHSRDEALDLLRSELKDQGILVPDGAAAEAVES